MRADVLQRAPSFLALPMILHIMCMQPLWRWSTVFSLASIGFPYMIHSPPSSILGEALIYTIITTYPFALLVTKLSRIDEATFVPCSHRACTFMMLVSPKIVKADQSS